MGLNNKHKSTYINIYTYNIPYSVWLGNGGTDEVSYSVHTFSRYSFIYLKPVKTLRFFDKHKWHQVAYNYPLLSQNHHHEEQSLCSSFVDQVLSYGVVSGLNIQKNEKRNAQDLHLGDHTYNLGYLLHRI